MGHLYRKKEIDHDPKYCEYSEGLLFQALEEIKTKTISIREASRKYGIHRNTLSLKLKDPSARKNKAGGQTAFTADEEQAIISHINYLASNGYRITHFSLRMFIHGYLTRIKQTVPRFQDNMPGSQWAIQFFKRNNDKLSSYVGWSAKKGSKKLDLKAINEYFDYLGLQYTPVPAVEEEPPPVPVEQHSVTLEIETEIVEPTYQCQAMHHDNPVHFNLGTEDLYESYPIAPSKPIITEKASSCAYGEKKKVVRKPREYSDEVLEQALKDTREKTLSINEAARKYGVPRTTLSQRLRGVKGVVPRKGFLTAFSPEEEQVIVSHMVNLYSNGYGISHLGLRVFIHVYLTRLKRTIQKFTDDNMPGSEWANRFFKRHKEKLAQFGISYRGKKLKTLDVKSVNEYFDSLGS